MEALDKARKPKADAVKYCLLKELNTGLNSAISETQKDVWDLRDKSANCNVISFLGDRS
jgi:hypothetical protein